MVSGPVQEPAGAFTFERCPDRRILWRVSQSALDIPFLVLSLAIEPRCLVALSFMEASAHFHRASPTTPSDHRHRDIRRTKLDTKSRHRAGLGAEGRAEVADTSGPRKL